MEIRVLNYFLMVAREENITRAANLLHITQPTLSRQLIQLEEELGVKLFHRGRHRVTLTEDGMLLRRRAEEIVSIAEKVRDEMRHDSGELTGTISVGSGELQSSQFLAELIASFCDKNPLVRFDIYSGNSDDIKERIERGLTDVGLLQKPVDITKYDFMHTPVKERWGVLVCADSPLAGKESVTPRDLDGMPLILPQRALIQNDLMGWFGSDLENLHVIASGNHQYNLAILAKNSGGCVITIELELEYDGLKFVPLNSKQDSGTVLVWKKGQTFSRAADAFIDHCKNSV